MSGLLLVSTRKGLFHVRRDPGGAWAIGKVSFLGDNVSLTLADARDGHWYAALDHGHFGAKLHRSSDQGDHWEEVAAPAYPEPPEGHVEKDSMGRILEWRLQRIWCLEAGHASQDGVLWAGTIPGGLFRSADRGASWTLARGLWDHPGRLDWVGGGADFPGIHSICVDPRNADRVSVAVSCGGVWSSQDGGITWDCTGLGMRAPYMPPERQLDPTVQDPHRMVQSPSDPDHCWIQHHSAMYRSTDGGRNWRELENVPVSVFGFPVAVHPADPLTAWFVPGDKDERRIPLDGRVVVVRTRDGGRSFETLRQGLPQVHAYDLVYRHALAVDGSGARLAFGSTTGHLWVTEDGGDHWTTVAGHLPPVYAVAFAD